LQIIIDMNKALPILFIFCFAAFLSKAQIPQSTATYGFEEDLKRIIDQWKPEANDVLELRFKPVNDNHTFPRKGSKRHSILLQYVNDSVQKQQYFSLPATFIIKTANGWMNFDYENGKRLFEHSKTFIKDSAGYRIEESCTYYNNFNNCSIHLTKYDSLNRLTELKFQSGRSLYISKNVYLPKNKIRHMKYCVEGNDSLLMSEFYLISEPWAGQDEKIDSLIQLRVGNRVSMNDTIVTIYRYQYNNSGKIESIKRMQRRNEFGKSESKESECYVIYRKRYPKRRVRELPD